MPPWRPKLTAPHSDSTPPPSSSISRPQSSCPAACPDFRILINRTKPSHRLSAFAPPVTYPTNSAKPLTPTPPKNHQAPGKRLRSPLPLPYSDKPESYYTILYRSKYVKRGAACGRTIRRLGIAGLSDQQELPPVTPAKAGIQSARPAPPLEPLHPRRVKSPQPTRPRRP